MSQSLSCPACGAPLRIDNRFVRMVTCDFCGQVSLRNEQGLDPTGRTAKLVELPSLLYVGARGTLRGRRFEALGRLRYQYDGGFWDEWFLTFEGDRPGWLVEDEGTLRFYVKQTLTGTLPPWDSVAVGTTLPVGGKQVFVTERGRATIAGGEGQLAFTILPGEPVQYLDGSSGDNIVSIEYAPEEIEFSVGFAVPPDAIVVDEESYW